VHSFVHTVLIGTGGLDQDRVDPQLDPPYGQLGKPGQAGGGEGDSIVGFYCLGNPCSLKALLKALKLPA
jgi:hypothetical protein